MGTPSRIDTDSMLILLRYIEKKHIDKLPHHFDILFWCNFDGRKIDVIWRTLFDVISMCQKSTSFWHTLFNVTSMIKIATSFRCNFFELISIDENSTLFRCIFLVQFRWKTDLTWARIFWYDFEGQKIVVVLISLVYKFLIY